MVKGTTTATTESSEAPTASTEVIGSPNAGGLTFGPNDGGNNILAAWNFLYWVFGARVSRFDVTPEGIYAVDFSVAAPYDAKQIITDMDAEKSRRLDLITTYPWVRGEAPSQIMDVETLTRNLTTFVKDSEGHTPEYAKTAIASYKAANGLAKPRGRKPRLITAEIIGELTPESLEGVDIAELDKLEAFINAARANRTAVTA